MITLDEALQAFYGYSEKLSGLVRQLSFAGIAVIWLFKVGGENAGGIEWDDSLLFPLVAFVLALMFDLLQYVYYSLVWALFHRKKERHVQRWCGSTPAPDKFYVSPWINRIGYVFFVNKTAAAIIGYMALLFDLSQKV